MPTSLPARICIASKSIRYKALECNDLKIGAIMANYAKTTVGNESRVELHEVLGLTGAEVSVNNLPAGAIMC